MVTGTALVPNVSRTVSAYSVFGVPYGTVLGKCFLCVPLVLLRMIGFWIKLSLLTRCVPPGDAN